MRKDAKCLSAHTIEIRELHDVVITEVCRSSIGSLEYFSTQLPLGVGVQGEEMEGTREGVRRRIHACEDESSARTVRTGTSHTKEDEGWYARSLGQEILVGHLLLRCGSHVRLDCSDVRDDEAFICR